MHNISLCSSIIYIRNVHCSNVTLFVLKTQLYTMYNLRKLFISPFDCSYSCYRSVKSGSLCRSCFHLFTYWTPTPAFPRRVLCENACCQSQGKMFCGLPMFRDAKTGCIFLGILLITYYFIMDIILFMRFRSVNIVDDSKPGDPDEVYSPFTHLSVKALMNDHTSQYVISPTAEYFDLITKFSTTLTFITPNVISFTHLFLGILSGKFVASENLHDRRIGVIIFQVRTWLDAFDGVVYRSQSGTHLQFQSVRATTGYYVDTTCDLLGGVFLCFGVLFYLWKRFDPYKMQELPTTWSKSQEAGGVSKAALVGGGNGGRETYSKKYLFWKVLCYGLCLACAGKFWDLTVGEFRDVFQVEMKDPQMSVSIIYLYLYLSLILNM